MNKYYIARDKYGALYCYKERPTKGEDSWQPVYFEPDSYCELDDTFFPEIKWENKEPKIITIEESPWVKVEDRLPDVGDIVICACKLNHDGSYFYRVDSINENNE